MKDDGEDGDEGGGEGSDEDVMKMWWRCDEGGEWLNFGCMRAFDDGQTH